ncbi:MAG: hypothetical protein IJF83_04105 [Methanobrevibacter sp.]|nr:hypothetical protein [Methanobrevibacter sp.]
MQKKNKTELANKSIIIISLILVFLCIALVMMVYPANSNLERVEWNGMTCFIEQDSAYTFDNTTFTLTSPFPSHNLQLKKTRDSTNYDDNIRDDFNGVTKVDYNATHCFLLNAKNKYGAIVPNDAIIKSAGDPYKLEDNTEIIEVTGENPRYMDSFIASSSG